MSHTPVSQRLCQFVKINQNASKEEVLGLFLNIFEEGIVKVYQSYYIYFNKVVRKKCKMKNKTYSKSLKNRHF